MIKIIFFANFCKDSKVLLNDFTDTFLKGKNNYSENISFTSNPEEATHAVVLNETKCPINLPKENIIGIAYEPLENLNFTKDYIEYVKNNLKYYLIGCDLPYENFINYYTFLWSIRNRDKYFEGYKYEKKYIMSIILSKQNTHFGHKYRRLLSKKILESNLDIHIYGRGSNDLKEKKISKRRITRIDDVRIKGDFKDHEPYLEYYYSITIENIKHDSYISEKFTHCIATDCIPIYYGGRKIDNYFGEKCCYKITGNIEEDFELIKNIYNNYQEKLLDLTEAKNNFFEGKSYFMKFINDLWIEKSFKI